MKRLILLVGSLLICCGCSADLPAAAINATDKPAESYAVAHEVNTPVPQDDASQSRKAEQLFNAAFSLDLTAVVKDMQIDDTEDVAAYRKSWERVQRYIEIAAKRALGQAYDGEMDISFRHNGWKFVAAVYRSNPATFESTLKGMYRAEIEIAGEKGTCRISAVEPREAFGQLPPDEAFLGKLMFSYLNTVYDNAGQEVAYTDYELSKTYLRTLSEPLPGKHIKDGWYNDRDKGTRKHTGTDIRAAEGTDILSMSNGVVAHIGTNAGAGNYVVVLDEHGYEYHYYHMVRLTDFLTPGDRIVQGDVIGHVGNTGNSVANHLHLTMISPDYYYINPFVVLSELRAASAASE